MTPLDIAIHDEAKRLAAYDDLDHGAYCTTGGCVCPTCEAAGLVLRAKLLARGVRSEDAKRVQLRANDFRGGAHPYLASVRVDGREIYRIMQRPDEALADEVLEDIQRALRRPM